MNMANLLFLKGGGFGDYTKNSIKLDLRLFRSDVLHLLCAKSRSSAAGSRETLLKRKTESHFSYLCQVSQYHGSLQNKAQETNIQAYRPIHDPSMLVDLVWKGSIHKEKRTYIFVLLF